MDNNHYINNYYSLPMKLTVQTLDQKTFDVTIDENASLQTLRDEIGKIKDHPSDQLKLIYNGAVLDKNEKKLSEYKVVDGTKIILLLQKTKPKPVAPAAKVEEKKEPAPNPVQQPADAAPAVPVAPAAPGAAVPAAPGAVPQMAGVFGAILQQNPQAFMQLLMADPYINQLAQANPQMFAQMIGDPNFMQNVMAAGEGLMAQGGEDETLYEKMFEGEVKLSVEQKKEVQDIVDMGFQFEEVIQLYVAYGHSKELTVNALFDEQLNDDIK